jgi:hypothetical protein
MQPTTLLDNLNSDFLAAFSALLPKSAAQQVLVYVESDEDIAFWRGVLMPFEKHNVSFDIQLPSKNTLKKGKLAVLEWADQVGTHLILCVDSDYDYLLQNTTPTSTLINTNAFIFQTYSYSIENLLCYAKNLHLICVQASKNDTLLIDFEALMQLYSKTIYKLFLWSVYFVGKGDNTTFTLTNFCNIVKILEKVDVSEQFRTALQGVKYQVDAKIEVLERNFPDAIPHIEALAIVLEPLGVQADNVYLFMQVHTIKENVVLMCLKDVFRQLKHDKAQQIKTHAKHEKERQTQLNSYKKQVIDIETALNSNTDYKSCFLFKKIERDLDIYIQKFER